MKIWVERSIYTVNEQIATIRPNESMDGIVLKTSEIDGSPEGRLYLTPEEATVLANDLLDYVKSNF